jgi:exopolysaccharide production protein ExoZ
MKAEIFSLQYLRGIAALMIVLVHVPGQLSPGGLGGWSEPLKGGVDIFFVISGFIMWVTTCNDRLTAPEFMWRRLVRIVPLYWIVTTFVVGTMVLTPSLVRSGSFSPSHIASSYFFIATKHPMFSNYFPVLIPAWTLIYEMFFYVIFSICLFVPVQSRAFSVIGILSAVAALRIVSPGQFSLADFYTNGIILEFAFGILIGVAYSRGTKIPNWALALTILLGIFGMALTESISADRYIALGVPAALIVAACVLYERFNKVARIAPLESLGNSSYSLYLSHGITISAVMQVCQRFDLMTSPAGFFIYELIAIYTSIAVALAMYHLLELPLIGLFRHMRHRRSTNLLPAG